RVLEPPLLIRARLVSAAALDKVAAEAEPLPETVAQTPPLREEPEALPPKEVPDKRPEPQPEPKPREPEPAPVERKPPPQPRTEPDPAAPAADDRQETALQAAASGPSVQGTDTNFPFAWYLANVEGQIARNWRPRQLGFGERSRVSCAVHFVIARNGAVSRVTMVQGSGVGVYDREALRAVQATRLPPLPPQYGGSTLGVTFIFNLEPGM
ncbi:MAG: TonB family protein, partial [Candidatus Krumholzibacteriia bacterium]